MTASPGDERLAVFLVGFVDADNFLDQGRHFFRPHSLEDFARDTLLVTHAATHHDMIALGTIGELYANETNVAAVMLCAGMRTAGEMKIYRRTHGYAAAETFP